MIQGALYLEKGQPADAVEALESISPDNNLYHSLLLANALREQNHIEPPDDASRRIYDQARNSVLESAAEECEGGDLPSEIQGKMAGYAKNLIRELKPRTEPGHELAEQASNE